MTYWFELPSPDPHTALFRSCAPQDAVRELRISLTSMTYISFGSAKHDPIHRHFHGSTRRLLTAVRAGATPLPGGLELPSGDFYPYSFWGLSEPRGSAPTSHYQEPRP